MMYMLAVSLLESDYDRAESWLSAFNASMNTSHQVFAAGLKSGDMIERINGTAIQSIDALKHWLDTHPKPDAIQLSVRRNGRMLTIPMKAVRSERGDYRLGLYVRDKTSGVGTLTFYDPTVHRYGALGHVITDADTGRPIPGKGELYPSEVFGIIKGTGDIPAKSEDVSCARRKPSVPSMRTRLMASMAIWRTHRYWLVGHSQSL